MANIEPPPPNVSLSLELLFDNIISGLSYLLPILIALPLLPSNIRSDTVDSKYDTELVFILLYIAGKSISIFLGFDNLS